MVFQEPFGSLNPNHRIEHFLTLSLTRTAGHVRLSAAGAVRLLQLDAWRIQGVFGGPRPLFP
jgi:ABC-type microcin C transport system duplicated ATPase subunit YejF